MKGRTTSIQRTQNNSVHSIMSLLLELLHTSKDSDAGDSSPLGGRWWVGEALDSSGSLGRDFADCDRDPASILVPSMLAPMETRAEPSVECPRADASALCTVSPSLSDPRPDDEQDQLGNSSGGIPRLDLSVSCDVGSLARLVAGVAAFLDEFKEVWLDFKVVGTWWAGLWFTCVLGRGITAGALSGIVTEATVLGCSITPVPFEAAEQTADSALLLGSPVEPGVESAGLRWSWRSWETRGEVKNNCPAEFSAGSKTHLITSYCYPH